jgi:hypothetical protein
MKVARFISIEDEGSDLILSFAIDDEIIGIRSLILMRTPKFEMLSPKAEQGVSVSFEGQDEYNENDLLVKASLSKDQANFLTRRDKYEVDISKVGSSDKKNMLKLLNKMNFDASFELKNL